MDTIPFYSNKKYRSEEDSNRESTNKTKQHSKPRRRSFQESRELEDIDRILPLLEQKKVTLEQDLNKKNSDLVKVSKELAEVIKKIESFEERWLELSELIP